MAAMRRQVAHGRNPVAPPWLGRRGAPGARCSSAHTCSIRSSAGWSTATTSAKATWNATKVIDLERALHVFVEPSIQAWALHVHWVIDIADWTYLNAHYFVTLGALLFIYIRRNDSFYFVRNMFMIAMVDRARRLRRLPDGAAPADARVGLHRRDPAVHRRHRREGAERAVLEPLRGDPLDARLLRADGRPADGPAGQAAAGEDRLVRVSAVHLLRGDRDRQPLPHRRLPRARSPAASRRCWPRSCWRGRGRTPGRSARQRLNRVRFFGGWPTPAPRSHRVPPSSAAPGHGPMVASLRRWCASG